MPFKRFSVIVALALLVGCSNKPPEPRLPADGVRTPINTQIPAELRGAYEEEGRN